MNHASIPLRFVLAFTLLTAACPAQSAPGQAEPKPQDAAFPLAEAARRMTLPDGFKATLFAGEPDVAQPIAFTIDDRGRLWVAECYAYPDWQEEDTEPKDRRDRILIFEDADGDGRFDSRKVFADKLINLSGIEVGFGGVWVCSTPNLLFFPDRDGDDRPDSPRPTVLLNGFTYDIKHNVVNGLTWGPDGWLYGLHGILDTSNVGPPTLAPDDPRRVPINCAVWKIHPATHAFEAVAHGTTNPFGLDFDDYGQMFITNCVISHLWHIIPGAHYERMYGQDFNPYTYELMQSCADHLHWAGGSWTESRGGVGKHGEAGGGHAHVGAMVYLGDNWPAAYRNGLFTCNLHGNRVNHDTLERKGSGYIARHAKDFLLAHDTFFRGLELQYGPDGGVYLSDWSDTGECHDYDDVKRESGRIFKITYGNITAYSGNITRLSDGQLVDLQLHRNDWYVRRARLELQKRAHEKKLSAPARRALAAILNDNPDLTRRLRALWALHVTGGLSASNLVKLMGDREEFIRAWSVQLAMEGKQPPDNVLRKLDDLARTDPSPVVHLYLASALQRLPVTQRWSIAESLASKAENANDANLPLMIWYGIEPAVLANPQRALALLREAKIPVVREYIARRLASGPGAKPAPSEAQTTPSAEPSPSAQPAPATLAEEPKPAERKD